MGGSGPPAHSQTLPTQAGTWLDPSAHCPLLLHGLSHNQAQAPLQRGAVSRCSQSYCPCQRSPVPAHTPPSPYSFLSMVLLSPASFHPHPILLPAPSRLTAPHPLHATGCPRSRSALHQLLPGPVTVPELRAALPAPESPGNFAEQQNHNATHGPGGPPGAPTAAGAHPAAPPRRPPPLPPPAAPLPAPDGAAPAAPRLNSDRRGAGRGAALPMGSAGWGRPPPGPAPPC